MTDYLWDKSGDADPDVERLERALSVFAQALPPPSLRLPGARLSATSQWIGIALLAASVAIAAGGVRVGQARIASLALSIASRTL